MVSVGGTNNIIVNESGTASTIENYKIVILGDQFVGKTSILHKYKYESVDDKYAVQLLFYIAHCWYRLLN
jgi:GTPase SAR1 family protein